MSMQVNDCKFFLQLIIRDYTIAFYHTHNQSLFVRPCPETIVHSLLTLQELQGLDLLLEREHINEVLM